MKIPELMLNNGIKIPSFGFGTWNLSEGSEVVNSVSTAIDAGYRLIDTASIYRNERGVGEAVKNSSVPRQEIFVTTKLWTSYFGYDSAKEAFAKSLSELDLEYIDLYLIHWPGNNSTARIESWRALIDLQEQGLTKAIGVSNYETHHLEELLEQSNIKPAINQVEFHPYIYARQRALLDFCRQEGIKIEAYTPLADGDVLKDKLVVGMAKKLGKTPAQIVLRWAYQHGTIPIPKSAHPQRIRENIKIFDFELTDKQMDELNLLSVSQ